MSFWADAEADLVFRLAGPPAQRKQSVDLGAVKNWPRVLQLASHENALIALRDELRLASAPVVPLEVQKRLAILSLDVEYRMRTLERRLEQSLAALSAVGIDALLLKGGALACTVYDSFAARPMRDIDLLVRPDCVDEARAVMLKADWREDPDLPGDGSYQTHHHLPPLRDSGGTGLRVEIHRSLLAAGHPFRLADDDIWSAARRIRVGKTTALVMHPAHHATYLAIHFAWSHRLKMGAWHAFRDIAAMEGAGAIDWNALVATAGRLRASTCCYWTLRLGQVLAGLAVPEGILHHLEPRLPQSARMRLTRHFANGLVRNGLTCPSTRLDNGLWTAAIQPRRQGHGGARPWLSSLDLQHVLNEKNRLTNQERRPTRLRQICRSARYLSKMLG